ncbi:hypothetical protein [Aliarcobacter butzleri]|uniref:hypothetical protein n=1 Tax=Aliarcobacter butzleri TaxID=28197 RepID=UPI00263F2E9A|nr:hypothetical protein [Aliarcobacter butzleri]MDN5096537.1 hypothetical protein [Aliarcobacter butzleri]
MCCLENEDCLEEFDDDFYDEEFEEKPSKTKKPKTSSFDTLKKHFDIVEVEEHEIYDLFICKNKIKDKASFIQYEAWLCTKIKKGSKEGFAEGVLKYIDKLINFDKTNSAQLSLFIETSYEENKRISIKDLSFWDCINDYYLFDLDDYLKDIPKDNEEMMAFVKKCITLYFENPEKKYDFFCFDYDEYLTSEPISDREMLSRLYSQLRMYFGLSTYVEDKYSIYLNEEVHKITKKGEAKKRFYASYYGARLKVTLYDEKSKLYDLYDKEFCSWLREKLNVPYREPLTDNEVIKDSLLDFSKRFIKDEKEFYSFINDAKDAADFRKNIVSYIKKLGNYTGHMGGGGSPLDDCYSISYGYDLNHLNLEISQLNEYRKQLDREIDLKSSREDYTYIFKVKGVEVFEKMYEYLSGNLDNSSTKLDSFKSTLNNVDEIGYSDEQLNCFMNGSLF